MVQAMVTPLRAQLATVAELHAECTCMAACYIHPDFPLCLAGIAPVGSTMLMLNRWKALTRHTNCGKA